MDSSHNVSSLVGFANILITPLSANPFFLELLLIIQTQLPFSTIFLLRSNERFDIDTYILNSLDTPFIRLTTSRKYQLKRLFKDDMLAVVYLDVMSYGEVLNALVEDLHGISQTRILFVGNGMTEFIPEVFNIFWKQKLINAILFLNETYISFRPFPKIRIEEHIPHVEREVFPNQLSNLHRYPLRIVLDGIEPRNFFYTNRNGEERIGGYSSHVVASLAEKINATLTTPMGYRNRVLHHTDYDAMIATDVIDIYAGLAFLIPSTKGYSDVAESIWYCLIVPVEPALPQYLYYPMTLGSLPILLMFSMVFIFSFVINCFHWIENRVKLSMLTVFLREDCMRSLLGQSIIMRRQRVSMKLRMIYFMSCMMGLFFSVWYLGILNTLVTTPPRDVPLQSLEDIRRSPLKILMYRPEYDDILKTTDEFEEYADTFEFTFNNTWYHATRNALNKSYSFPVPENKWRVFEEQQSLYKVPLYRKTDMCIVRMSLMVFLLHENSIFTRELNQMIVRSHQSGLYQHWLHTAFLELVEGGRIKLDAHIEGEGPSPLTLDNMRWLWGLFGALVLIDLSVFAVEIVMSSFIKRHYLIF